MVPAPEGMEMKKADGEMMEAKKHVIVSGDNFWNLAKKYYGDATMWKKIDEANPGMRKRGLKIGTELTIPN